MTTHSRRLEVVAARWILGATFLYLGAVKALDPVGFLKLAHQFEVLSTPPAVNFVAAVLPWFEIFCGVLLILGVKPRATATLQGILLAGFTTLVVLRALALHQAFGTSFCAISFDCGCGTGEVNVCMKLVENTALMILTAVVALIPSGTWCLTSEDEPVRRS